MIQQDYLERLTQQVAKVLARLIGKDWENALLDIEQVYHNWLPFKREEALKQLPAYLLDWLIVEQKCSIQHIEVLAELLYVEGVYLYEQSIGEESRDRLIKAVRLFEYVDEQSEIFSFDRQNKIARAKELLDH